MPLETLLQQALTDPETGWNMGSFGAIAEFHHVAGDPMPTPPGPLTQVTTRGGVRIDRLEGVRPVAWEMLSPKAHRWSQGISLCLPKEEAAMHKRPVLTALGPDSGAIRPEDRAAELFDMGLAQHQVDFCIRTADPELRALLHAQNGRSLFEIDNPAMGAILKAHPARVALTRVGRVEVYQMIGGPDTGGKSPEGPHTHVLPKLLRSGRTHSANTPIPKGWVPCCSLHPENPVIDRMGADKVPNRAAYEQFQSYLAWWGIPEYLAAKAVVNTALAEGRGPEHVAEPSTRLGRTGLRTALRQAQRFQSDAPSLGAWVAAFDKAAGDGAAVDTHEEMHQ
ncbi:MAG: hypothetical protein CSA68_08830 [Rhodobacterales bacterium]|nr:MAG: hypothetical protein CSA68_08830 [Rhodobacterales bacterium]